MASMSMKSLFGQSQDAVFLPTLSSCLLQLSVVPLRTPFLYSYHCYQAYPFCPQLDLKFLRFLLLFCPQRRLILKGSNSRKQKLLKHVLMFLGGWSRHACAMPCMSKPEDDLRGSALSFLHVGSRLSRSAASVFTW